MYVKANRRSAAQLISIAPLPGSDMKSRVTVSGKTAMAAADAREATAAARKQQRSIARTREKLRAPQL